MAKATKPAAAQAPVTAMAVALEAAAAQAPAPAAQAPAPAAVVACRDTETAALILKAGEAANSMLDLCKQAAKAAAAQLNPAKPMGERIEGVMSLYAADFVTAGHNVKALFKDALTLHAAAQTPVTVKSMVNGKATDVHTTAADAVNMPKHAMKDAAAQVRAANNMSRKTGGGRKPAAAKMPAAAPAAPDMTVTATEIDGFTQWLANFDAYFTDVIYHQKIVARAIECGYVISKATKGVKVTSKKHRGLCKVWSKREGGATSRRPIVG